MRVYRQAETFALAMPIQRIPPMKFDADIFDRQASQFDVDPERAGIHSQGGMTYNLKNEPSVMMSYIHRDEDGVPRGMLHYFPEGSSIAKEQPGGIQVMVHPEHQGKGIGNALLDAALARHGPDTNTMPHWAPIDLQNQNYTPSGYGLVKPRLGALPGLNVTDSAPRQDRPAMLVYGGAFNPPHEGHVGALQDAHNALADAGYKVDGSIVAPTADKLLAKKQLAPESRLDLQARANVSRVAFPQQMNGAPVQVATGPSQEVERATGKPRRSDLANWAQRQYPNHTIINITGEDATVPGAPDQHPSLYSGEIGSNHEGVNYLTLPRDSEEGMSSSKIRAAEAAGASFPGMTPESENAYREELAKHRANLNPILAAHNVLRVAEQLTLPITTKLYRGVNIDTTEPGLEKVHAILHPSGETDSLTHHSGWDHPEIGGALLDWMEGEHRREKKHQGLQKGLGRHWTGDSAQAESFARWPNEETGRGGNLQAVVEADWGFGGEDPERGYTGEFSPTGERIRSFPWEKEHPLLPGTQLNVTGVKIRPYDDAYWNDPGMTDESPDENHDGPWHHVLSNPSQRLAMHP